MTRRQDLRAGLGRADLVAALAASDDGVAEFVGARLGLRKSEPEPQGSAPKSEDTSSEFPEVKSSAGPSIAAGSDPLSPLRLWIPERVSFFDHEEGQVVAVPAPPAFRGWRAKPAHPPVFHPLTTWAELAPRLRRVLSEYREGRAIDLERTVRAIGRGRILARLPRERRRRWGPALVLLEDDSRRLIPFRLDRRLIRGVLTKLLPAHALGRALVAEGTPEPQPSTDSAVSWPPPPGTLVLALGDLGCLATSGGFLRTAWLALGRELMDAGCYPLVLFPGPLLRCERALCAIWRPIPWERPREHDGTSAPARAERLLRLIAPAARIEPGLLRAARLLLPPEAADAATEADVWQHPALAENSPAGAAVELEQARRLRAACSAREPAVLRRRLSRLIRAWRRDLPPEIWFDELLNIDPDAREPDPSVPDLEDLSGDLLDARAYFHAFCHEVEANRVGDLPGNDRAWLERIRVRSTPHLWGDPVVGRDLATRANELVRDRDGAPSDAIGAGQVAAAHRPEERWRLVQRGAELVALRPGLGNEPGSSPLADVLTRAGRMDVQALHTRDSARFWERDQAPPWADDWGWDDFGAWVEFSVRSAEDEQVTQRMRWIQPDRFEMGSPLDEPERDEDEGPRHEVRIAEGFWLFDTACPQALWVAVMEENPSQFKGPDRPVETVSWNEAQRFIERLNARLPGLALGLPSEAQWEYACRAGTETPFSFGVNITPGQVNYDGNYPYPGGSKGEYREETVDVKQLPQNPWGLYQMHGNLFEWVQDAWHGSYEGAPVDGTAWESDDAGVGRVVRGGSWYDEARLCRCAARLRLEPGVRGSDLGFRCARVQGRGSGQAGSGASGPDVARPAERIRPGHGGAVSRSGNTRPGNAAGPVVLRLDSGAQTPVQLPVAHTVEMQTDREHLTLRQITKPDWASAMGRDRFGLWADITVEPSEGDPVIQRLRWIPPGRFTMGSPQGEPGRWDGEGAQHEVVIGQGYWLFDTPCTQALWEALMGENPSGFRTPDRPVERVSWEDVQQRFLPALNERIPGFILPSEAQWEYACRAGTNAALYTGPIEILGDANAPALDPIAWYGGNSSVGFELENGVERSWLKEMQYPDGKAGTHPVKGKLPNGWGLYDMLGNADEWVQDAWHDSYEGAPADGSARESEEPGVGRVFRGGSWVVEARFCRCAYRDRDEPDDRDVNLGFRCARVQVGEQEEQEAERASLARPGPRSGSGRAAAGSARGAPAGEGVLEKLRSWVRRPKDKGRES